MLNPVHEESLHRCVQFCVIVRSWFAHIKALKINNHTLDIHIFFFLIFFYQFPALSSYSHVHAGKNGVRRSLARNVK